MKRVLYLCVVSITAHCYAEKAVPKERETLLSLLEEIPLLPVPKTLPAELSEPIITKEKDEKQRTQPELAQSQHSAHESATPREVPVAAAPQAVSQEAPLRMAEGIPQAVPQAESQEHQGSHERAITREEDALKVMTKPGGTKMQSTAEPEKPSDELPVRSAAERPPLTSADASALPQQPAPMPQPEIVTSSKPQEVATAILPQVTSVVSLPKAEDIVSASAEKSVSLVPPATETTLIEKRLSLKDPLESHKSTLLYQLKNP